MNANKFKIDCGFTLIELLVSMSILAVLATVGLTSFKQSQLRSADVKRKSDLEQIQRALEMFYNDNGSYPSSSSTGTILIGSTSFDWGSEFKDSKETVYMKELPVDPVRNPDYCYFSSGNYYKLYAKLQNSEDPKISGPYTCAETATYNYGVSSSNSEP